MTQFMLAIIFFIVAIGVLVSFHEYGHFWVARRLGVKVLRFSIGFGRPLWSWRRREDDTEYVVAAIPLGGYVQMLDEREGEVPQEQLPYAFNRQPLASRFAIVAAGPVFNFVLAIAAYWLVFVTGVTGVKPVIGGVEADSLAARAGLAPGELIMQVGQERTPTWERAVFALLDKAISKEQVTVHVQGEAGQRQVTLGLDRLDDGLARGNLMQAIGIAPPRPEIPPVIAEVERGMPAADAGLQGGDRVVSADGQPVADWNQLVAYIRDHPGEPIEVMVVREGQRLTRTITPQSVESQGRTIGRIGAAVELPDEMAQEMQTVVRYGPLEAVGEGLAKTWQMSALTVRMLASMVLGQVSVSNISGPIGIAEYAGYSASAGITTYLSFLAIVSISLGILNLLPIPLLDGGHLLYYIIEFFKGSPVSEEAQMVGQRIGIAALLLLMGVAFYNDITRLLY